MISFRPSEDETAFFKVARKLAEEQIRPQAKEMEDSKQVSSDLIHEMKDLGFYHLNYLKVWRG
ncbi:acyl-CoA dehydrogenase family protein [Piscibacillus salipiscarius]|uniref:acyl-CoA dehydrogenase family protein n=1 Tax=Piscibacillus salipiscarius TaxID=299480 RepID=UPI002436A18F|nr:acyl-CoA dehydrogenase family protein [Piscibacillus salipiscarius]